MNLINVSYIDPIQFIEQPIEIQEVLKQYHNEYHNLSYNNGKSIPIMDETELRKFIQHKLDFPNIYFVDGELTVEYECYKGTEDCDVAEYVVECNDMLEGYWKLACIIADTEVKHKQFWEND